MATTLPDVQMTVQDGGLGITPPAPSNLACLFGVCSAGVVNQFYTFADTALAQAQLGTGDLVEAVCAMIAATGGAVGCMPVNPSVAGASGSVTHVGPGVGAVAIGSGPAQQITIVVFAAGALAVGSFTWQVGTGPVSAPVILAASFTVPGTQTTLTFGAGNYALGETWTIAPTGVITQTTSLGSVGNITAQASNPLATYQFVLTIKVSGPLGTATFTTTQDAGATTSAIASTVASGKYAIPGTGVFVTFTQPVVTITLSAGGALGTMTFNWSVAGGGSGASGSTTPNSGANFNFTVPSTGIVLVFTPATYVNADVYTDSALGVVSRTSGTGPANAVSQSATSTPFVALDTYSWTSVPAGYSNTDLTNAFTALMATANAVAFVKPVGTAASAAAAAGVSGVLDTLLQAKAQAFRYLWAIVDCPTLGSLLNNAGAVLVDVADTDTAVVSAFQSFVSDRVAVAAGDFVHISAISGKQYRRPAGWQVANRAAKIPVGEALNWVGRGSLTQVGQQPVTGGTVSLFRDENATPALDAQRFCTLRQFTGYPGYYITNAYTMAAPTSDFHLLQNRRVMDVACTTARTALLPQVGGQVRVYATGDTRGTPGTIFEQDARKLESTARNALLDNLVRTTPANAVDAQVKVNRAANVIGTQQLPVTVSVFPVGYSNYINVTIGFVNPAVATS